MMRLAAYAGVSLALATTVILKAMHQRANFYSACVYLSQSNANLMIITNLCLLLVGFLLFGLQRLLYGRLRPIETEQLYEKAWFAVTETCLAMTIFRGELGAWFVVMFVCLLVGKVWGWIGEGRVEILEQQPPSNPRLFHSRLATSLLLAVSFDIFMLKYAVKTVLRQARPDMMVMFGFEFAVLTILSTSTMARYTLSLTEIYIVRKQKKARLAERRMESRTVREEGLGTSGNASPGAPEVPPNEDDLEELDLDVPGWEEKGRWVFYLDLLTDFLKLVVYLSFFAILFTFYGMPIHILRDVVLTMRSFARRILDFLRYRAATRDMNQRYPDATPEEVAREDVCIICREEMRPWLRPDTTAERPEGRTSGRMSERLRPKKLPCGHLLHFACLRSWLERQQNCPTCRRPVTAAAGSRAQEGQNAGRGVAQQRPEHMQAQGGRPRAWLLNLGPLRVGFGAGRGEDFHEVAQQFNAGHAQVDRGPAPNPGRADPSTGDNSSAYRTRGENSAGTELLNLENVQTRISELEREINLGLRSLSITSEHLRIVRLLQNELIRLRAIASGQTSAEPITAQESNTQLSTNFDLTTFDRHPVANQSSSFTSGGFLLPEEFSLPPGWTLTPLHEPYVASSSIPPSQSSAYYPNRANLSHDHFHTPTVNSTPSNPVSSYSTTTPFVAFPPPDSPASLNEQFSSESRELSSQRKTSPGQSVPSPSKSTAFDSNFEDAYTSNSHPKAFTVNSTTDSQNGDGGAATQSTYGDLKGKSRAATVDDCEEYQP